MTRTVLGILIMCGILTVINDQWGTEAAFYVAMMLAGLSILRVLR
ncbi:MAG: hypothetical protein OXS29_13770 [bacterium]|nr:hypothetical protein [bacterium]